MNVKNWLLGVALLLATGCSSGNYVREAVPPRVDLQQYPLVGLVGFSSNARGELDRMSTERFLRALHEAQPGTRIVELGSEREVLASLNRHHWDRETLRLLGEEHGVDAILLGRIEVERCTPDVSFSSVVNEVSVNQNVNAELTARLVETGSGATLWTDGAKCTTSVANASFNERGRGYFGASDPEAAYGGMIDGLVLEITDDFRVHYITRRVPKNAPLPPAPPAAATAVATTADPEAEPETESAE